MHLESTTGAHPQSSPPCCPPPSVQRCSGTAATRLFVAFGLLLLLAGERSLQVSAAEVPPSDRDKIEAALPGKAIVPARKPRRLLIFDRNVNYGGHASIATATLAFTRMGQKTGAFETEVSTDPAVFQPESLRRFDAVYFNNNVGNLFTDPALRQSLVEFIYSGGGMLGVHGTTVAFTQWPGAIEDWPEFGLMIGARGANHKASNERVIVKLDDLSHPLNQPFASEDFEYRDEFFRVHEPYSRHRLRVLLSIDTEKTDMNQTPAYGQLVRKDNDYALAWVRQYGRGRSFYCTIAHNPSVFWDPKMLQFYLGAIQFALGDLAAPTIPSAKLTPAIRAQEKLGWQVGLAGSYQTSATLGEAIEQAGQLGLPFLGASSSQRLSSNLSSQVNEQLSNDDLQQLRFKLDAAGVRLLTYAVRSVPDDESGCRTLFAVARKLGVEALILEGSPTNLDLLERLCDEFDLQVALRPDLASSRSGLTDFLKLLQNRNQRLGVALDLARWQTAGIDPVPELKRIGRRLITVQWDGRAPQSGAEQGTGAAPDAELSRFLQELHRVGSKPVMIALPSSADGGAKQSLEPSLALLNKVSLKLAGGQNP